MKIDLKNKCLAKLIAGGITLGTVPFVLSGCGEKEEKLLTEEYTISELLENKEIAKNTKLDELEKKRKLLLAENITYVEAADLLVKYMDRVDLFDGLDLNTDLALEPVPKDELKNTINASDDDIEFYVDVVEDESGDYPNDLVNDSKERLAYLKDYYKKWIKNYGMTISIEIMQEAVKGALTQELNISENDYFSIKFSDGHDVEKPNLGKLTVNDKVYNLVDADNEITIIANYIYYLESAHNLKYKDQVDAYRESIDYAKNIIIKGLNADSDELDTKYSNDKANKILIMK